MAHAQALKRHVSQNVQIQAMRKEKGDPCGKISLLKEPSLHGNITHSP